MAPPRWDVAISGGSTLSSPAYPSFWVSVRQRIMRQTTTSTGMQYELAQAQTGELRPVLDNRDAAFSPVNTSSPYSPQVVPFTPFRIRAQVPATTNILTADQATAGDASGIAAGPIPTSMQVITNNVYGTPMIAIDAGAWQGTRVYSLALASGAVSGGALLTALGATMAPNLAHSFQAQVRDVTAATSIQVAAALTWVDVNGNDLTTVTGSTATLTGSATAPWTQITVSGTPPANAAGFRPRILLMANTTANLTFESDGWQVEYAAAPSAWVQPGAWLPVFYGGAERWPQVYDMGGTFGQTQPVITDAFSLLAGMYPLPAFFSDVLALNPAFFFPLNDPVSSAQCSDISGSLLPAPVSVTQYGAGSLTFGSGVTSTSPGLAFLGYPGPVATFNNTALGLNAAGTYVDISRAGNAGPPASGAWTRFVAFRAPTNQTNEVTMWAASSSTYSTLSATVAFHILGSTDGGGHPGFLDVNIKQSNGSTASHVPVSAASVCDGNWHYVFLTCDGSGNYNIYSDTISSNPFSISLTNPSGPGFNGILTDLIGMFIETGTQRAYNGFVGDLGCAIQWNFQLAAAQIGNLAKSWRNAWSGERSGARYARILGYAGYTGLTNIATGATADMGPATDIDGKTDALTLLQNVVTTENGVHYVSPAGPLTFEARTNRYDKLTPVYTFGEQINNGEWPYEDVAFDFDTTHVIGQAQITQNSTGQIFVANSPTTLAPNYRPTYQRTINVTNPQECVDAANYLANRYAKPQLRVQKIRLHPAALSGLWAVALALTISTRVRVMRRPPAYTTGTNIQFDGFIESIKWGLDWDTGDAIVDLEISPADLQLYWVLAALHTTIHTGVSSGANSVVLNALPDAASNPASASLCSGLQMTMEPGTANAETLTVASFSATSPGYTTFTVTFTANFAHNHAANAVVCEALPTGITDPTTWDPASILGTSTTLAY